MKYIRFLGASTFLILGFICSLSAQEQGPERWEATIQKFEKSDKESSIEPGAILFIGISSIAMWRDIANYFPEHRVLN